MGFSSLGTEYFSVARRPLTVSGGLVEVVKIIAPLAHMEEYGICAEEDSLQLRQTVHPAIAIKDRLYRLPLPWFAG